jgi:hypothetical protein
VRVPEEEEKEADGIVEEIMALNFSNFVKDKTLYFIYLI